MNLDFSILLQGEYPRLIAGGLVTMLELAVLAWMLALALGTVLAVIRLSNVRWARAAVAAYVEYHQSVPILVQIFLWYFGIPTLLPEGVQQWFNKNHSEFVFAFIAIGLCMAAYMSEDLRGGIRSIPKAQLEASRALGMTYLQACRKVILPQAIRIALPPLISHTVLLFKNTSLAMTIGVLELTYVTRQIESDTFRTVEVYLFATLAYLGISVLIMTGGTALERRYQIKAR
ncbi:amino acid ABC transporter permease [Cupriavidus necator]